MNINRGFKRVTRVLAIAAAVFCVYFVVNSIVMKYRGLPTNMFVETIGDKFWDKLSLGAWWVIGIFAGIAAALIGYYVIWIVYGIIKWLILGFYVQPEHIALQEETHSQPTDEKMTKGVTHIIDVEKEKSEGGKSE